MATATADKPAPLRTKERRAADDISILDLLMVGCRGSAPVQYAMARRLDSAGCARQARDAFARGCNGVRDPLPELAAAIAIAAELGLGLLLPAPDLSPGFQSTRDPRWSARTGGLRVKPAMTAT